MSPKLQERERERELAVRVCSLGYSCLQKPVFLSCFDYKQNDVNREWEGGKPVRCHCDIY